MPYLYIQTWKTYCHTWNQHHWICKNVKLFAKIKILKFGIKKALFDCFGGNFKNYWHIWNQCSWISWIEKFRAKIKTFNLGQLDEFLKLTLKWIFNQYSKCCHRVRFFKRYRARLLLTTGVCVRFTKPEFRFSMVPAGNKAKRISSINHTTKNDSSSQPSSRLSNYMESHILDLSSESTIS